MHQPLLSSVYISFAHFNFFLINNQTNWDLAEMWIWWVSTFYMISISFEISNWLLSTCKWLRFQKIQVDTYHTTLFNFENLLESKQCMHDMVNTPDSSDEPLVSIIYCTWIYKNVIWHHKQSCFFWGGWREGGVKYPEKA